MFVHNQIGGVPSHYDAVTKQLLEARKADLIIAYVQESGVSRLKEYIVNADCEIRLVCSFDMEITNPVAVKQLMDMGAMVKIYQAARGTLHAKLWLFENADGEQSCLIGSANLSAAALHDNVEAGVLLTSEHGRQSINKAKEAFDSVWSSKNCQTVTDKTIGIWIDAWNQKEATKKRLMSLNKRSIPAENNISDENVSILEDYVRGWINIGVSARTEGESITGRLWRGWYIIPDQGYIDDEYMARLHKICAIVSSAPDQTISLVPKGNEPLEKILELTKGKLVRPRRRMNLRSLFIRQEKNYLLHFGFAIHPEKPNGKLDKNRLMLTKAGSNFALAESGMGRKRIYTRNMRDYSYNNLPLLKFLVELLEHTKTLSLIEFSFFVCHAYAIGQIAEIAGLIDIYRNLSPRTRQQFENNIDAYFREKLEPTASNVRGNYDKKIKHTMSALGWCQKLQYDAKSCELRLRTR